MKLNLRSGVCAFLPILLSVLLSACSSFDTSARAYAEQNENAIRRQQAEQDRPPIDNQQVYLDMIREMQDRSLYFASLAHIDAYLKSYDSTPEVQRLRADALRATDQADAAETQYRALLPTTQAAAAWHGLGLLAGQRGDYPAAIADFREAVQREPINADMLNDLGYALLCGGDRAAARLPLMQAIELAPDNRKVVSNLALFLLLSNEREKAEGLMARASFPAEVRTEVFRQAAKIGGTAIAVTPALPAVLSSNFMQPMLERFRSAE